jgi:predicted Zn-dependent protease
MIRRAGWAAHLHAQKNLAEAQQEYERLATDFPKTPNVQYAYARFLTANREDEKAITAFQREIENSPNHALARFQIAYIKLRNKQAAEGVELAEQAVKLHPRLALGRYLFGRLLFDVNQNERAIVELEAARGMTPNDARIHFALARAYARANRKIDADKARETFTRLNRLTEEAAARGVNQASAIEDSPAANAKPQSP